MRESQQLMVCCKIPTVLTCRTLPNDNAELANRDAVYLVETQLWGT